MSKLANHPTCGCPLCWHRLPYGTSCKDPTTCGQPLNLNAATYLNPDRTFKRLTGATGMGISEIANKEE